MRRFGLIGKTLKHSFSASYFAEKFQREGLAGECSYELYELPEIDDVIRLMAMPDMVGFNVTIPYKQQIISHLDGVSAEVERIGAVNCVKREADGRWIGYNTDVVGVRLSLDKLLGDDVVGHALVLGSGGAAQAVRYVLQERGIDYRVVSRSRESGDLTYEELDGDVMATNRLIVNCSPVGMYPNVDNAPTIPYAMLSESHYLFDLVYNPTLTRFMQLGAERGASTLSGIDMLHAQAEAAWAIWNR